MKKLIGMMVIFGMFLVLSAGCGDDTTIIEEHVSKTTNVDLDTCETDDDCVLERQMCRLDADRTAAEGFGIFTCQHGCDARMLYVENEDGTSSGSKDPGTDTCQRFGNMDLYCDLFGDHECKEYSDVVIDDPTVPVIEPVVQSEVRYVEYCYSGGSFMGLWGQIAWSEATQSAPDAWKPGRDLDISVLNGSFGCFGTNVIWADALTETGMKVFYADMTRGKHVGIQAVDALLEWLNVNWYPDFCTVDGEPGVLGDYVDQKGHPCWVPEK